MTPGTLLWDSWESAGPLGPNVDATDNVSGGQVVLVLETQSPPGGVRVLIADGRHGWVPSWRLEPV